MLPNTSTANLSLLGDLRVQLPAPHTTWLSSCPWQRPCGQTRCLPKSSSVSTSVLVKCHRRHHQQTAANTITSTNSPGEITSSPSSPADTSCAQGSGKTGQGTTAGGHWGRDRPTQVSQANSSMPRKVNKSRVTGVSNSPSCSGHHPLGGMN